MTASDWSRDRFTMDDGLSRAVRTIFKRLYDAGLIYQAERLVNWSPVLQTAISDLEVKYEDVEGELVSFRYGSMNDDEPHLVVATTRLETMLGDTAIAVHPDDDRYRALVGQTLPHPFLDRQIIVVADGHVDPEFGTGAVKVTPAHDPNDFEIGLRHNLPMPSILDTRPAPSPAPEPGSTGWTGSRRGSRCVRRWRPRAASSPRSGRTCTASGTPNAAASRSSRG